MEDECRGKNKRDDKGEGYRREGKEEREERRKRMEETRVVGKKRRKERGKE